MANVAVIKKLVALFFALALIALVTACYFIYRYNYLISYREVELEEIAQYDAKTAETNIPHWISVTTQEQLESIKEKYNFELPQIDFEKNMFVIAYGAELIRLEYNLKESTYKTRGSYIGFSEFGDSKQNVLFVYKAQSIPLIDTDVAGVSPDYRGKYRK